jgi:hypothetical protein
MKISRSLSQASALAALALTLAACGGADAVGSAADDDSDSITLAADTAGTPVGLPYKSGFGLSRHLVSRPFQVRAHSSVTVVAKARWETPESCRLPTFRITLYTATEQGPGRPLQARNFPANGAEHIETWKDLPAGEYTIELDTTNTVKTCHLLGDVDIEDR